MRPRSLRRHQEEWKRFTETNIQERLPLVDNVGRFTIGKWSKLAQRPKSLIFPRIAAYPQAYQHAYPSTRWILLRQTAPGKARRRVTRAHQPENRWPTRGDSPSPFRPRQAARSITNAGENIASLPANAAWSYCGPSILACTTPARRSSRRATRHRNRALGVPNP